MTIHVDKEEAMAIFATMIDTINLQGLKEGGTMAAGNRQIGIYVKFSPEPHEACKTIQMLARLECVLAGQTPRVDGDITEEVQDRLRRPKPREN